MTNFQIAVIVAAIALLLIGVLIFAGILPGFRPSPGGAGGQVTLWGTLDSEAIRPALDEFGRDHKSEFTLVYKQKDARTFEADLVDALAANKGPDLVILPSDLIVKQSDKLLTLPYQSYSLRQFKDTFATIGQLYLTSDGIIGFPLYIDPLVIYNNQDLLTNAKLAKVPATWNELQAVVGSLSKVDLQKNISQSMIALGQFNNIANAKDILAALIMQAGNPITARDEAGVLKAVLKERSGLPTPPAAEALAFFNRFSDPSNVLYSWNSALPEARSAFLPGTLAFYIGYASDWPKLKKQNPQLNLGVELLPQRVGGTSLTFGRVSAAAALKNSGNPNTALLAAQRLSEAPFVKALSEAIGLPPARKDLLAANHPDPAMSVFYQSAIISRGWLDPDPAKSQEIFRNLASNAQTGRLETSAAVTRASDELQTLIK
ncbi:MAG: extracellular solute-binding protein [Candidatus Vogelbacteria bacterium]|nr:extracellular solute-binding protein [Candidatus Vogelbacteria bacterium]